MWKKLLFSATVTRTNISTCGSKSSVISRCFSAKTVQKLYYFNGRGRGELSRLLLAEGKIKYEDVRINPIDWQDLKSEMPFGKIPVLEFKDSSRLAESGAIERFIARLIGVYGSTLNETARIDMIYEVTRSLYLDYLFSFKGKDGDDKAMAISNFFKFTFPNYATILTSLLKENKKGESYFVGDQLTLADIAVFDKLYSFVAKDSTCLSNYPELVRFIERIEKRPNIAPYLNKRPTTSW